MGKVGDAFNEVNVGLRSRVKKAFWGLTLGVYFLLTLASCEERWDDPIPEGVSLARASLLSELTEDNHILFMWGNFQMCNGWRCIPSAEASPYDLLVKRAGMQNFARLVRRNANQPNWSSDGRRLIYSITAEFFGK